MGAWFTPFNYLHYTLNYKVFGERGISKYFQIPCIYMNVFNTQILVTPIVTHTSKFTILQQDYILAQLRVLPNTNKDLTSTGLEANMKIGIKVYGFCH